MNISSPSEVQRSVALDVLQGTTQNQEQFLQLIDQGSQGKQLLNLAQQQEQISIAQQAIASGQSFDVRI